MANFNEHSLEMSIMELFQELLQKLIEVELHTLKGIGLDIQR